MTFHFAQNKTNDSLIKLKAQQHHLHLKHCQDQSPSGRNSEPSPGEGSDGVPVESAEGDGGENGDDGLAAGHDGEHGPMLLLGHQFGDG